MKKHSIFICIDSLIGGILLLFLSCGQDENLSDMQANRIPITFSGTINGQLHTKVTATSFEAKDSIGLFATLTSNSLEGKRYIDNLRLTYNGNKNSFTPARTVYYPEGKAALDFIGYHPYQSKGLEEGSTALSVSIHSDQSTHGNFSASDFLTAKKQHVESSDNDVVLNFIHRFAKLKFTLIPGEGEDAASILEDDPRIIVTNIYSQANFNLINEKITNLQKPTEILPYGSWSNNGEKLTGKEMIIIPQSLTQTNNSIIIEWNGRIYTCQMPEQLMRTGTQCEISITATQKGGEILDGVAGIVSDWATVEGKTTDNNQENVAIHTAAFSFRQSDIYRIYHEGKAMVDICKEYLISNELTSKAIVAYPILTETESPDLKKGTVLKLLDTSDAICGGTIIWDAETNHFTYEEGDKTAVNKFYVEESGTLNLTSGDHAISCDIASLTIKDTRDTQTEIYPIVKIGTQYWMKEDLRADCYNDGTPLKKLDNLGAGVGYFKPEELEYYFYNGETVLAGELSPEKWSIPSDKDWEDLKNYIGNDASLLKAGTWSLETGSAGYEQPENVAPVNNLTGFSVYPRGSWLNGKHNNNGRLNGYWALKEGSTEIADKMIFFTGGSNNFYLSDPIVKEKDYYKAASIRCILK